MTVKQHLKRLDTTDKVLVRDVNAINKACPLLLQRYSIVDAIGEGTFSTVYKAVDEEFEKYDNSRWMNDQVKIFEEKGKKKTMVALKRIYTVSSPQRILTEISLLQTLSAPKSHKNVLSLITAFRHEDQIFVITPYVQHDDFRYLLHMMSLEDMRFYFKSLVAGLSHIHSLNIIHRDIKPSNFLYDYRQRTGVVADFGLAHYAESQERINEMEELELERVQHPVPYQNYGVYVKDPRKPLHADRAGTRGFRAPEVLFKTFHQTPIIDMWSVGVILLCLLTRQFPFFNSQDDQEAIVEIACIFGQTAMEMYASIYRRSWNTRIPTIPQDKVEFKTIVQKLNPKLKQEVEEDKYGVMDFLKHCLEPYYLARLSSSKALKHQFLSVD
ncbi:hypothetical protein MP228_000998 [Amoeboaphelidium protococcarum]|nr:hypothetical protein MP228_000998 [Amoeboaphelidium protococcarum]